MIKYTIGIDIGSRYTKVVLWNIQRRETVKFDVKETGLDPAGTAKQLLDNIKKDDSVAIAGRIPVYSTGYGRKLLKTPYVSEITCHAKAVAALFPRAKIVIDIGGQDSKVIILDRDGIVCDFAMNDKCAAGTGSFLESIARLCKMPLNELEKKALDYKEKLEISSTCVVFAESEIISLMNRRKRIEDILMGVHLSIAYRIKNMLPGMKERLQEDKKRDEVVFTGGVANNKAMVYSLEQVLEHKITIPPYPSLTGALGAAFYAAETS